MLNYHKFISAVLGLLYMIVLVAFSNPVPIFRFLLPAFVGVLLITFFYNRYYLKKLDKYNFWILMRPLLLQTGGFLMYFVLLNSSYRGLFLISSAILIAIFEIMLANFSENVLLNETLIIAFGFCFAFFGLLEYFPSFGYLYLFGAFIAMFLLARCFYEFVPHEREVKLLNALMVSFLSAQVFWAANFLPFHYSALGILALDFFYVVLVLNYHSLFNNLSVKRAKFYLSLAAVSLILVFSATPWTIID